MLAEISYFKPWQIPLFLVFGAGWLVLGGILFQRTLTKYTDRREVKLSWGVFVSLASGSIGAIIGVLVFLACKLVFGLQGKAVLIGIFPAAILAFVMAVMTVFTMHKIDMGATFRSSLMPLGAIGLLGLILFVPMGVLARNQVNQERHQLFLQRKTLDNLQEIFGRLTRKANRLPYSLEELKEDKEPVLAFLKSPANPEREVGFFYFRPADGILQSDEKERKLLICDFHDTHPQGSRAVLFMNGKAIVYGPDTFEDLLRLPENKDFAEALKKAEE